MVKSTVANIWKNREKISSMIVASDVSIVTKKWYIIHEKAKFDLVDYACWKWFSQQQSKGALVSGPKMQEKALYFFKNLYPDADSKLALVG